MEFCPHCRSQMPILRKTVDVPEENERHVQTLCRTCQQVIFEAVRPLDEEPPAAERKARPDLNKPLKHRSRRPRPKQT